MTTARRVAPGREVEFEEWASRLTAAGSRFDGFLGAGLLRPGHVGEDWHVVYRFDSPANLAAWEGSPVRAALLCQGEELMETRGVQRVSGLETWFELPGRTAPAPPPVERDSLCGVLRRLRISRIARESTVEPLAGSC